MKLQKCKRRLASILGMLVVCSIILTDHAFGGIWTVYAAKNNEQEETAAEAAADLQETTEEPVLVEDTTEDNLWYNTAGNMQDFRDETIYFVMTTRFYDGDPSNNVQCWDGTDYNGEETPWQGDFRGLIDKLDYIKALGFTAIWITPVAKNASGYDYHGYHPINFKEVDSRYESEDCTYQDLIDAVHAKGMKIIQDVVFNHTSNFGEENLNGIFTRDDSADLAAESECMIPNSELLAANYLSLNAANKYQMRVDYLKDTSGTGKDAKNVYHHGYDAINWDDYTCQMAQIAGDCVDLNTENPLVYKYLVDAYSQYIKMGVDAFRVDTARYISRLSLNQGFIGQLNEAYNQVHGTTGERNFYMFGEVDSRFNEVWYRDIPALSAPFYTWKESKEYNWIDDENDPNAYMTNIASTKQHYDDNSDNPKDQPVSSNAFLDGNNYHEPDHSMSSGLDVIDFPMHWNFGEAQSAFALAESGDKYYNDATYNVVYVDSHDYAPAQPSEEVRFSGTQEQWAENLSLMFTFRGIPCIYYGSEVEFMKGKPIDKGPNIKLNESGRAYFGDHIEGSVDVVDFAKYANATGAMAESLNYPLSLHIQRLNRLRAAIPALRKGQYSTTDCDGAMAYKRRYTDETTDSFALIALTSDATFKGIPNGTYTDAITGDVKEVTNGTLTASGIQGKGDLRVYVLDTELTKAPGMIEGFSDYMSGGSEMVVPTVEPAEIKMTGETTATIDLAESVTLQAEVFPAEATNKSVTWKSSDTSIATVSKNGRVTGKGEGTVTIYAATSNAGESDYTNETSLVAKATITVKATGVKVTEVVPGKTSVTLDEGCTETITVSILPENANENYKALTWHSADPSIAEVNSKGVITAVKKGKTTVTVSALSGASATIDVEVIGVKGEVVPGDAIYFQNKPGWGDNIYAYIWVRNETNTGNLYENNGWPGVKMLSVNQGEGIYGIGWPEGYEDVNIIFTDQDKKAQTADLKAVKNALMDYDGNVIKGDIPHNTETTEPFKISYEMNGHGTAIAGENIHFFEKAIEPDKPSEAGYLFGGWYKTADCNTEEQWDFENDFVFGNTVLYAKWTECNHLESTEKPTCTEGVTCSVCGEVLAANGHTDANHDGYCEVCNTIIDGIGATLAGYSLSLSGDIGVKFYMELTQEVLADPTAYMLFKLPNESTTKLYVRDIKANGTTEVSGKNYYVFTCHVAPKEINHTITAQMHVSDNAKTGKIYQYKVVDYMKVLLGDSSTSTELRTLLNAMLYYGSYAQVYFNYNTESLAADAVADKDENTVSAIDGITADTLLDYAGYTPANANADFLLAGSDLTLNSKVNMRVYFTTKLEDVNLENYKVTFNEETTEYALTKTELLGTAYYYVALPERVASEMFSKDDCIKITRISDHTEDTYAYSIGHYCYNVMNRAESDTITGDLKTLIKSLVYYQQAAKDYFEAI